MRNHRATNWLRLLAFRFEERVRRFESWLDRDGNDEKFFLVWSLVIVFLLQVLLVLQ